MKLNLDKSGWKKVRLGDVATAPSIRINNPSESGFDRFIGNANIGQWDFRLTSWESTDSVTSAMKGFGMGDYLFVRRSLYASDFRERSPRATFAGVCSGDIITIRENPEKIADGFLIGVLNSPEIWKYVVANASGSITRRIKWRDLANYEFLLPPKDQQAKLAELLWAADGLVEQKLQIVERIATVKEALIDQHLQEIAKNGKTLTIAELASKDRNACCGGPFGSDLTGKDYVTEPGVPVIRGTNLTKGGARFVEDDFVYVSDEKAISLEKNSARRGDILVTQRGTLGQVGLIPKDSKFPRYIVSQSQMKVTINENLALSEFVYYYLLSKQAQCHLEMATISTGVPHINLGIFKNFRIPIPPLSTQSKVTSELSLIDRTIDESIGGVNQTKLLRKSLINQIF